MVSAPVIILKMLIRTLSQLPENHHPLSKTTVTFAKHITCNIIKFYRNDFTVGPYYFRASLHDNRQSHCFELGLRSMQARIQDKW